jgi:hypothetical protein
MIADGIGAIVMVQDVKAATVTGVGVLLGVVALALTFGQRIGLGVTLWLLVWVAALLFFARTSGASYSKRTLVLLFPLIFFAVMLTVHDAPSLTDLNVLAFTGTLLLFTYYTAGGNVFGTTLLDYPLNALRSGVESAISPFFTAMKGASWLGTQRGNWRRALPIVRGAAITVPIVGVFLALFGSADAVFGQYVDGFLRIFGTIDIWELAFRVVYMGVVGWAVTGTLVTAITDHSEKCKGLPSPVLVASPIISAGTFTNDLMPEITLDPSSLPGKSGKHSEHDLIAPAPIFRLGFTEAIMALSGVCVVFGAFVAVQFAYLFGGLRNIDNFSFAEYARRGFVELVAVAVLALALIFTLKAVTAVAEGRQRMLFRILSTVILSLTSVVLLSGFQRLRLYELTYGFTTLRLTIYITIVWLGVLLVGMTLALYWTPRTIRVFESAVLVAVFGIAGTHNLISPDAFVAWQNIQRGDIDPVYLSTLSVEAAPALVTLLDAPDPGTRWLAADSLWRMRQDSTHLAGDWREWNLSRAYAASVINDPAIYAKIEHILTNEQPKLPHSTFKAFLQGGLTFRQVARQFGRPDWTYTYEAVEGDHGQTYEVTYLLDGDMSAVLSIDSTLGLRRASICPRSGPSAGRCDVMVW